MDGDYAWGDWGTDIMEMGDGTRIAGVQFGIGQQATSDEGILGIGLPTNEADTARYGQEPYKNLPQLMADQGLIESNAYSLWLNDLGTFGALER